MIEVSLMVQANPGRVFDVLANGWTYAGWVVGASHIRQVDAAWPAKGTRIHHSVGPWPLQVHDSTEVLQVEPGESLELQARMWPFGAARVRLELEQVTPGETEVRMYEEAVQGPTRRLPERFQAMLLVPRNRESLQRLAHLAVGEVSHSSDLGR